MLNKLAIALITIVLTVGAGHGLFGEGNPARAATPQRWSVWEGAYGSDQAANGSRAYQANCVRCHGVDLEGRSGRALAGETFMDDWREGTVRHLYDAVTTMPISGPKLSDRTYLNIVAYILESNGFPPGYELVQEELREIRIEGPNGPQPVPDRATVQVVGCFTRADGDDWTLSDATELVRIRNSERVTSDEVALAKTARLGESFFGLQNFFMVGSFDRDAHDGHKVMVKGVLIRDPEGDRISLTAVGDAASTCQR